LTTLARCRVQLRLFDLDQAPALDLRCDALGQQQPGA